MHQAAATMNPLAQDPTAIRIQSELGVVHQMRAAQRQLQHRDRTRRNQAGLLPASQEPPSRWTSYQQMNVGTIAASQQPLVPPVPTSVFSLRLLII